MAFDGPQTGPKWGGFGRASGLAARLEAWLEAERTQLPLWVPVGLVAGVASWFWLPDAPAWEALLLSMAALALLGFAFGRGGRVGRSNAIFALAVAIGCGLVWWKAERVGAPVLARAEVARFTARIERVEPLPAREAVRLTLKLMAVEEGAAFLRASASTFRWKTASPVSLPAR